MDILLNDKRLLPNIMFYTVCFLFLEKNYIPALVFHLKNGDFFLCYIRSCMKKPIPILEVLGFVKWFTEEGWWISGSLYLTVLNLVIRSAKSEKCCSL